MEFYKDKALFKIFFAIIFIISLLIISAAHIHGGLRDSLYAAWICLAFFAFIGVVAVLLNKATYIKSEGFWDSFLEMWVKERWYGFLMLMIFIVLAMTTDQLRRYLDVHFPLVVPPSVSTSKMPAALN